MPSKLLEQNEHVLDRAVRVVLGLVLLSLVLVGPKTLWGLVGLVPLATGLFGSCPAYRLFGINTCRTGRLMGSVPRRGASPSESHRDATAAYAAPRSRSPGTR
jgi:hypothetical protein